MSKIKRLCVRFIRSLEKASQEKARHQMVRMGYSMESIKAMNPEEVGR